MSDARLRPEVARAIERGSEIERRLVEIMDIVVAEWSSDPQSVACFDLRLVDEAKNLIKEYKQVRKCNSFYF